jgi:hypothetical protein
MDTIVETAAMLVVNWRIGLLLFGSLVAAVFLASTLQWFTGAYGIGLVLVGFGSGMVWQGSPNAVRSATDKKGRK